MKNIIKYLHNVYQSWNQFIEDSDVRIQNYILHSGNDKKIFTLRLLKVYLTLWVQNFESAFLKLLHRITSHIFIFGFFGKFYFRLVFSKKYNFPKNPNLMWNFGIRIENLEVLYNLFTIQSSQLSKHNF